MSGRICLNIINEDTGWWPAITIKQMLVGFQDLLDSPNISDPAQLAAVKLYEEDVNEYRRRVRQQALLNVPDSLW